MAQPRPLALTMGEPAGIGGELAIKAWLARAEGVPPFVALDDPDRLRAVVEAMDADVSVAEVDDLSAIPARFADVLPVLPMRLSAPAEPGRPSARTAPDVIASIERAVALAQADDVAGVVTNPIQKKPLLEAGFEHPGHTEFLGALAGPGREPVMMLVVPGLRVVPVTGHIALSAVAGALETDTIVRYGEIAARALVSDFGVVKPRLAVAALNPHGGEAGAFGDEEARIIAPAVERLTAAGVDAAGPKPADTLFHAAARERYDAVLCMYHDQALIPLKTVDFDRGVNVTLNLPFVRTSPDHGTALDIAGTGKANPASLIAALRTAAGIAAARRGTAAPVA